MDTILFSGVGCCLILLAIFLNKKHKHFMSLSIEVPGEIIDVVERIHTADKQLLRHPIIKYRYNRFYKFKSDVDISKEALTVGSSVIVRINPMHPKAAKWEVSLQQNRLFLWVLIGLGLFFIVIGAVQYKPIDFDISLFDDWFTLGFVVVGGVYLYIKLSPLYDFMKHSPAYTENATEVDE